MLVTQQAPTSHLQIPPHPSPQVSLRSHLYIPISKLPLHLLTLDMVPQNYHRPQQDLQGQVGPQSVRKVRLCRLPCWIWALLGK